MKDASELIYLSVTKTVHLIPTLCVTAVKLRGRHFKVPSGTADNSPAIHCRVRGITLLSSPVRDGGICTVPAVPDGTWQEWACPTRQ
ncbi:MAG: hypothetical protein GY749_02635 [Desulfobacteraceae bacterium]|nr:hypothetical protein [Desulfobacteraceae bacterium]